MNRDVFIKSQCQFHHAVAFFSRPMAALMSRLPTSQARQVLMHNLAEEHGFDDEGTDGFRPTMAHDETFSVFLNSLGVESNDASAQPPVQAFNLALLGICLTESPAFAFSALGIIEYTFADISALIGKTVVDRGWILYDDLVHYKLHAEIDKRHAAEFFESIDPGFKDEKAAGLALGLHIFDQLYSGLLEPHQ